MSLDDLDLEFEDEEAENKSDAVSVDVDLEFGTDTHAATSKPSQAAGSKPVSKPAITPKPTPAPTSAPSRPTIVAKAPTESNVRPISPKASAPSVGSSALKVEEQTGVVNENQEDLVTQLKGKIEQVEMDAQIKIAVAEFKTDILSDLLSDIKLLEHQVGGLLGRIHTKHPDLKQEVLMIKKLLSEFSSKKRK